MSPDPDGVDDAPDESADDPSDHPRGLLERLRAIVETLARIEEEEGGHRRTSGRIERGSTRIDYDYEVSIGLDPDERATPSRDRSGSARSRPEETGSPRGEEDPTRIETREVGPDERLVIADLPGVADDELDIEVDADESVLELRADEEVLGRVALDRPNVTVTDVTLNNRILELRLHRTDESTDGEPT